MQVRMCNIEIIKKISSSPSKDVYLVNKESKGAHKHQSKIIIAKYYLNVECSDTIIKNLVKELQDICCKYHPALNKYFGYSPIDEKNYPKLIIFSEYSSNGPLSKYIIQSNDDSTPINLDDTQKLIIAYGIASGMEFLHSKNIIHRHLKSDNIYLDEDLNPKISGFCSKTMPFTDSPIYLAPEIISSHQYSKEGDVYAFGIIAYEIFTNKKPFEQLKTPEQIFENVTNGKRPEFNSSTNIALIKLIENCWNQNPSSRPTFKDIVTGFENNPNFVKGIDEKRYLDYIDLIKRVYQSKSQKNKQQTNPEKEPSTKPPKNENKQKQSRNQPAKAKKSSKDADKTEENANSNKRGPNRGGRGKPRANKPEKREPIQNPAPKVNMRLISPSEVKCQPRLYQKGEIHFTSVSDFDSYESKDWVIGDVYQIEFFPTVMTTVTLLDASSDITAYVSQMRQDPVIFFDLEYVSPYKPAPPVCLFQFCCTSGAFLFKQARLEVNPQMKQFLSVGSGCKFVGKGVSGDVRRLKEMFGDDFEIDFEDVENTRLLPYGHSANFDQMVEKFAGMACAQFKDKNVSRSNWNRRKLSMKQVIYSAFDVVSLFNCYPRFQPVRHFLYRIPSDYNWPSNLDIKKEFSEFVKANKKCSGSQKEIEKLWNSNPNLVAQMLGLNLDVISFVVSKCLKVMQGHKLVCKLCSRSDRFVFTFKLVDHCLRCHPECKSCACGANLKSLFALYLFVTGRVILSMNECLICQKSFNSSPELENHCWNDHADLLNEFLKMRKNKSHQSDESDDDNDSSVDDNDNDDNVDDDDGDVQVSDDES